MKTFERYLRFSDPIWNAMLRTARTLGRREGVGRRLSILGAGLCVLAGLLAGSASLVVGQSGETPPRFSNHEPLPPDGRDAGEPSLGVTHTIDPQKGLLGRVMYIAILETLRATFDDCTSPARDFWEDVSPLTTPPTTLDPILFTDPITGRTFTSQLAGKTSIMSFSDDEGETWTQSQGAGINSGVDHQTVGGGPYPAGDPGSLPNSRYPHAVYYCSQDVATAQCALSRDGGQTFGPAVPIYAITECGGLHGHVKVGPDGTAYVANPSCNRGGDPLGAGEPGIIRSADAGVTWHVRTVQGAETIGSSDPAVGIGVNGTLYLGYEDNGRAMVAVSGDKGDSWTFIRDVSTSIGLRHIVFPQVTAGDDDRAAIAFLGTDYGGPDNPEGEDPTIPAVWYQYVAVSYNGGDTWVTTNATPGDPVQRGTVCGFGPDCGCCRNLLDFNDVTHDREGRIMAAYADGCIGGCVNGPPNSGTAIAKIARQVSGKGLLAAFDPTGTEPPAAVRLQAFLREPPLRVDLSWDEPDDRGTPIQDYRVYRRRSDETMQTLIASVGAGTQAHTDTTIVAGVTYVYQVRAFNTNGEGSADACSEVIPIVVPPRHACELPGDQANTDPAGDQRTGSTPALDIVALHVAEPAQDDRESRLVFTLKVSDLPSILQPGNAWFIIWNRPLPDASFDRNYVALRVESTGTRFVYGQLTPPSVNQAFDTGPADSGSVSATDDTIVISIANDNVDGVAAGQDLTDLHVRTFTSSANGQPVTQLTADDFSASGLYTLVGNASCDPRPFAVDDSASTPENQPVTINVVANDVDGDGDPLTVTGVTQGANGTVGFSGGTVTYAPNAGFVGTDMLDYTVSDPGGLSDTGTVTVIVFRSAPIQNPIADDAALDQVDGVDKDGRFTLSWSFPPPPDSQPCGFRIEESSTFNTLLSDDAFEPLVAGSNSTWTGNAPQWTTSMHPDTGTTAYHLAYTDSSDFTLTLNEAVALPAGPTKVRLVFDSFEDIEEGFDFGSVEVSADGGLFQGLASFTGLFSGQRVVDLSDFAGREVRIRFRLQSDLLISFPAVLGWFIDNIAIEAAHFAFKDTTAAMARSFDATVMASGIYSYRIAGLFGAGCAVLGPYSNVRQITVDIEGGVTQAPTADFTPSPNPATVGQSVTFDGSASHDNDTLGDDAGPPIASYFWAFGDGDTQTTTGPTTTHAYVAAGTYRATLTVTDNDGETASTERLVEVSEEPQPGVLKVTGGGSIPSGGAQANFGFNVKKPKVGNPSGHLNYEDKGRRVKVTSESVTSLSVTGNLATFGGACKVNKVSGFTFTVEAVDNGEAGTTDTFRIRLSNGYEASGTLTEGNIEIHKPAAKTTSGSTSRPIQN